MPAVQIMLMNAAAAPPEDALLPRLHPEEQSRYRGFIHATRRLNWRAGRALLLAALEQIVGWVDTAALRTAESGGVRYGDGALKLSLSHSGGLVGVALASVPVGFDLEWPRPRRLMEQTANLFSHGESAYLATLSPEERLDAFYRLWTLKEAACKAMCVAIWQGLRSARFDIPAGRFLPDAPFPVGDWACLHARLASGTRLALALRDRGPVDIACQRLCAPRVWRGEALVQPAWIYAS